MKKIVVRSAYYTDHKTKKTSVAFSIPNGDSVRIRVFDTDKTYGQMWLTALVKLISAISLSEEGDVVLSLVSGQPQCVKMAEKIERMFCLTLQLNDGSPERIKSVVMADGKYKRLPNDKLYEAVLIALWDCRQSLEHFSFEQHNKPSPEAAKVFNAARKSASKSSL